MAGFSFALGSKAKAANGSSGTDARRAPAPAAGTGIALSSFGGGDDEDEDQGAFNKAASSASRAQKAASTSNSSKPKDKPLSVFGEDDDEDDALDGLADTSTKAAPASNTGQNGASSSKPMSRASRLAADQALAQDAAIFEYDTVYDAMKTAATSAKQKQTEADKAAGVLDEDGRPAPKYIESFLQASVQRKRDRERAEAKKIQRERDAEGDEFADKEAFVTDAYREQMENIRKEEEAEAKRQAQGGGKGVQAFYSNLLSEQSAAHEAAVEAANAAASSSSSASPSRPVQGPARPAQAQEPEEESETAALARKIEAARASGLQVEINDDNQIIDNRSLLTKGLNRISKKQPSSTDQNGSARSRLLPHGRGPPTNSSSTKNLSTAQSFNSNAARARQTSHIEAQLLEVQRKRAAEEELEREKTKAKLMGVTGADEKSREQREEERKKARERALARRAKGAT